MYLTEQQVMGMLGLLSALCPSGRLAVNFGVGFEQQGRQRGRWLEGHGGGRRGAALPTSASRRTELHDEDRMDNQ